VKSLPLERTWGYRRRYVDAIVERAPNRAVLAVYSEFVRLGFGVTGCALVALIFGLLAGGAASRGALTWTVVGGTGATLSIVCGALALWSIARAYADLPRVRNAVKGGAMPGEKPAP
jgi:hypothetical protein